MPLPVIVHHQPDLPGSDYPHSFQISYFTSLFNQTRRRSRFLQAKQKPRRALFPNLPSLPPRSRVRAVFVSLVYFPILNDIRMTIEWQLSFFYFTTQLFASLLTRLALRPSLGSCAECFSFPIYWSREPCSFFAPSPAFTFLYSKLKTVPPPFGFRGLGPRLHPFNLFFKNWRSIIIWVMRTMSTSQTSPRVPVGPIFRPGSSHNNIMRSRCFHAADEAFFFLLPDYFPASFLFYLFFVYSFL